MRAVNLLPAKERARSFRPTRAQVAIVGAVVLAGGLGYWGYSTHADANEAEAALAAARTERDQVEAELQSRAADGAGAASLFAGDAYVEGLSAERVDGEHILRRVVTVTQPGVWYGNVTLDASGAAAAATAATADATATTAASLNLDGFAYSHTQVGRLMARISAIRGLGEPRLMSSKVELKAGQDIVHFTILTPLDVPAIPVPTGATAP